MSQENVEFVRRGFELFMSTGEVIWGDLDKEVVVDDHDALDQGEYRGHEGFARWLEDWGAAWTDWVLEAERFIDAGESVVIVARLIATGRSSGARLERQDALVYTVNRGKITRIEYYNNKEQALESVGLRE